MKKRLSIIEELCDEYVGVKRVKQTGMFNQKRGQHKSVFIGSAAIKQMLGPFYLACALCTFTLVSCLSFEARYSGRAHSCSPQKRGSNKCFH